MIILILFLMVSNSISHSLLFLLWRKESRLVHLTRHSPWLAGPLVKKVSLSLLALSSFGAVLPHCGIGQSWIQVKHLDFLIFIDSICQRLPTKAKICQKHANNAGNYCTVSFHIVPVQSFPSNTKQNCSVGWGPSSKDSSWADSKAWSQCWLDVAKEKYLAFHGD